MQHKVVCAECFGDPDIRERILEADGSPGCDFCGEYDAPTIDVGELGAQMRERLELFYSDANEYLMYVSREGGYQGVTYLTYDLLLDEEQLELPRDSSGTLFTALWSAIEPDRVWCEHDPAVLPKNESMLLDWDNFCQIIKYQRRFFFHDLGGSREILDESRAAADLLKEISQFIDDLDIIRICETGVTLYRARPHKNGQQFSLPSELGPPRCDDSLQSNRMNPPGIPMFYGAEDERTAVAEVRDSPTSVGTFVARKRLLLLDLVSLPSVPGTFSTSSRETIVALRFLHRFTQLATAPVDRDNRTHLDYIPTQVLTEYLRDYPFVLGRLDGVRYPSAAIQTVAFPNDGLFANAASGANVVLFATQADIVDGRADENYRDGSGAPWLEMVSVTQCPRNARPVHAAR
jgi:hypothetical protein